MGIFRILFKGVSKAAKTGVYVGSLYTLFGYFYVEQIKYRLGDSQQCWKKDYEWLSASINNDKSADQANFIVDFATAIVDVYTFYARTWFFRSFQQDCHQFHKTVLTSILNNYQQYGIFEKKELMKQQIMKNEIDPAIITKILHIKELNMQLTNLYSAQFLKIISSHIYLRTGAILGMSEEQKQKIDLIYDYFEKGERLVFAEEQRYWQYKLMQKQTKKHKYSNTIFKLIFI